MNWKEGWEANLERAIRAVKALDKASFVEVKVRYDGIVYVLAYPNDDPEEKRQIINGLTHLVDRLDKKISGSEISLYGEKDGLIVRVSGYDKCEIVGYVEIDEPEVVQTGHTIKRKVPVSDCELKQGRYAGKHVVLESIEKGASQ